jgi:hypothetical protein
MLLLLLAVPWLLIPLPTLAELSVIVRLLIRRVRVVLLKIPPPMSAEFPLIVALVIIRLPPFQTPPPSLSG